MMIPRKRKTEDDAGGEPEWLPPIEEDENEAELLEEIGFGDLGSNEDNYDGETPDC